jgi:hypothetical protein
LISMLRTYQISASYRKLFIALISNFHIGVSALEVKHETIKEQKNKRKEIDDHLRVYSTNTVAYFKAAILRFKQSIYKFS